MAYELEPERDGNNGRATLIDLIDRILDKGLIINADITISLVGVELLGIKMRVSLASFATAAKYGLAFPSGPNLETSTWKDAIAGLERCPKCNKEATKDELLDMGCPWCGWISARLQANPKSLASQGTP